MILPLILKIDYDCVAEAQRFEESVLTLLVFVFFVSHEGFMRVSGNFRVFMIAFLHLFVETILISDERCG